MKKWHVTYEYNGGTGCSTVTADDIDTAIQAGMAAAKPTYASDPSTKCTLVYAYRVLDLDEVRTEPHAGITSVISFGWRARDGGHPWLLVERGCGIQDLADYWTGTGALVSTHRSRAAAERRARYLQRQMLSTGTPGRYDVVPRAAVTLRHSAAPYGCEAGQHTAIA